MKSGYGMLPLMLTPGKGIEIVEKSLINPVIRLKLWRSSLDWSKSCHLLDTNIRRFNPDEGLSAQLTVPYTDVGICWHNR